MKLKNITILKDASAAAIYGNRAANGVIIITTKKGLESDKLHVEFSSTVSQSTIMDYVSVLSADQLRALIDSTGNETQAALLGTASTDWQNEIYRSPLSADQNLTFTGGVKDLPYRLTVGYANQNGILLRSKLERTSMNLNIRPTFLDDHLKVDLNAKFAYTNNFFADQGAIGAAVTFDPTQPVYSGNSEFGGYFEWLTPSTGLPNTLAGKNPVGLLYQKEDKSNVYRFIGNVQIDYKLHFLPELRANLNLGTDVSRSNGTVYIPPTAASKYFDGGESTQYNQDKDDKLLEFYLNYLKELPSINSKIDVTGGYSYQDWLTESPSYAALNAFGDTITPAGIPLKTQHTLISFYWRLNYTFKERYLLTATLRDDGSSRFSPDTRWGLFPSLALAWRISDEAFLKNSGALSNLKLRLGYGVVGQQDVNSDYPYIAFYNQGDPTAQYQFGNSFYYVLRPDAYDKNIRWEETESYNIGLDIGFLNGRISATIDLYKKFTRDLLAVIPIPAGTNFSNNLLTNVGSLENQGVELTLSVIPVDNGTSYLEIGGNVTFNENEITKLTKVEDTTSNGILVGGIQGVWHWKYSADTSGRLPCELFLSLPAGL
jgi:iron complex outermembrane receptor protein